MYDELITALQLLVDPAYEVRECVDEFGIEIVDDDGHAVFIGYFDEDPAVLFERLQYCENALDNWQE